MTDNTHELTINELEAVYGGKGFAATWTIGGMKYSIDESGKTFTQEHPGGSKLVIIS